MGLNSADVHPHERRSAEARHGAIARSFSATWTSSRSRTTACCRKSTPRERRKLIDPAASLAGAAARRPVEVHDRRPLATTRGPSRPTATPITTATRATSPSSTRTATWSASSRACTAPGAPASSWPTSGSSSTAAATTTRSSRGSQRARARQAAAQHAAEHARDEGRPAVHDHWAARAATIRSCGRCRRC